MGYPVKKTCFGAIFNKGLIRHLLFWETLHFQDFNMDTWIWHSQVNGPGVQINKCR